ncbi:MAG: sugar-transfer associated ATP-grasp domain-containing protein [bacterium]|nr:sugar-transfer associated ATP-grasp domain-containing protein [bacterium]
MTDIRLIAGQLGAAVEMVSGPLSARSYYPECALKSRTRICFDNLRWLLKHKEANYYYYAYGMDRVDAGDLDAYFSCPAIRLLREGGRPYAKAGKRLSYICVVMDKFLFGTVLSGLGFPTPLNIALCNQGRVTWLERGHTEPVSSLQEHGNLDVYCKPIAGQTGTGIFPLRIEDGRAYISGKETAWDKLFARLHNRYLIQERLVQHSVLSEIHPHSVNTVRIVTINNGKSVEMFSSFLRLGANGSRCDNVSQGGIAVSLNEATGELGTDGFYKPHLIPPGGNGRIDRHPDTGVVFRGIKIPFYGEAVAMAKSIHSYLYGLSSVGWDVAITEEGPVFIEGNSRWALTTLQYLYGGLRERYAACQKGKSG